MQMDKVSLRVELARQGLSQTQLARRVGCNRMTITRALSKPCRDKTARKIADALGVPLRDLVVL